MKNAFGIEIVNSVVESTTTVDRSTVLGKGRQYFVVFQHRDGRRVHYSRGSSDRDVEWGLVGRAVSAWELEEAFPGEQVCGGCVCVVGTGISRDDGFNPTTQWEWPESYWQGVRADYCLSCRLRVSEELTDKHNADLDIIHS